MEFSFIYQFRMFITGAFIAEYFEKIIPFLKKFWTIFLILYLIMKFSNIPDFNIKHPIIRTVFLQLATVGFGYSFHKIRINSDISYGIFIYHMIVNSNQLILI